MAKTAGNLRLRRGPMRTLLALMDASVRDVTARGVRIRVLDIGQGPTLVLVHGFLSNRRTWEDVVQELARDFRVIALDLPGFGESETPLPTKFSYDFATFAEAILDVTAALDLARVTIVGHGLGGSAALSLAATHPSVVEKLVLVSPLVYKAHNGFLLDAAALPFFGRIAFKQFYGRGAFQRLLDVYGDEYTAPPERIEDAFRRSASPATRESAHATLVAMADTRPLIALLPRVSVPTLVVWGREDRRHPVAYARKLARELNHARLEVFSCGHCPHEENPAQFCGVVREFLLPRKRARESRS